jgi:hypothetical protein
MRSTRRKTAPTDNDISRYPLTWPASWPRTSPAARQRARFGQAESESRRTTTALSVDTAVQRLQAELWRLGAVDYVLSTNLPITAEGVFRSLREPEDPGAAIYFRVAGTQRVLACDRWTRVADNVAAIAAHVDAIRAVDRYGVGTLDQAFAGYAALPASRAEEDWRVVLGVTANATLDEVETAFRQLARDHHPDVGGSHEAMARLTTARARAREALT